MDADKLSQTNDILRRVAQALEKLAPGQAATQSAIDALMRVGLTESKRREDGGEGSGSGKKKGGGGGGGGGGSDDDEEEGEKKRKKPKVPEIPDRSPEGMLKGLGPSAASLLNVAGMGQVGGMIGKVLSAMNAFEGMHGAMSRMGMFGDDSQKLGPPPLPKGPPPLPPDVRTLPLDPRGPEKPEGGGLLPVGTPLGKLPEAVPAWKDKPLPVLEPWEELKPADYTTPKKKLPEVKSDVPGLLPLDSEPKKGGGSDFDKLMEILNKFVDDPSSLPGGAAMDKELKRLGSSGTDEELMAFKSKILGQKKGESLNSPDLLGPLRPVGSVGSDMTGGIPKMIGAKDDGEDDATKGLENIGQGEGSSAQKVLEDIREQLRELNDTTKKKDSDPKVPASKKDTSPGAQLAANMRLGGTGLKSLDRVGQEVNQIVDTIASIVAKK